MTNFVKPAVLLGAIALIGLGVRLYEFGTLPVGLHQDEAGTAYDAFALLHYGTDRHGLTYPVVLPSWGSSQNALPAYLQVPFQAVGGTSVTTVRMGQLIACLLSAVLFVLAAGRLRGPRFAILSAFIVAIAPWHVLISRWALDENLFPAVFMAGVFFQLLALERPRWTVAAAICFGLSLYTHGAAYFVVPVYLALSTPLVMMMQGRNRLLGIGIAVFALIAFPIALYLAINMFRLDPVQLGPLTVPRLTGVPRFTTAASVFSDPIGRLPSNGWALLRLLVIQRDWNIFSAVPGYGLIYLTSMPFVVAGVLLAIRDARQKLTPEALMLAWLATAVALSVLLYANANRVNIFMFALFYFLARGMEPLQRWPRVFVVVCVIYLAQFAGFAHTYFTSYQERLAPPFFASFDHAIRRTSDVPGTVCITNHGTMFPHVFVMFHEQLAPRLFYETVVYDNPGEEFQFVRSFGRYVFGLERCPFDRAAAFIGRADEPAWTTFDHTAWNIEDAGHGFLVGRRRP